MFFCFLMIPRPPRSTRTEHSFPTRLSSDLDPPDPARSQSEVEASGALPSGAVPVHNCRRSRLHTGHSDGVSSMPPEGAIRPAPSTASAEELRSEEHTSELQSLMRTSYAVFCLPKKKQKPSSQVSTLK